MFVRQLWLPVTPRGGCRKRRVGGVVVVRAGLLGIESFQLAGRGRAGRVCAPGRRSRGTAERAGAGDEGFTDEIEPPRDRPLAMLPTDARLMPTSRGDLALREFALGQQSLGFFTILT